MSTACSGTSGCGEDAAPLRVPAPRGAAVCQVPLSQAGVLRRCCCRRYLLLPHPNKSTKKILALVCSSEIFFFPAAVRFQDDPIAYLLVLRGVVQGEFHRCLQTRGLWYPELVPTECITSSYTTFCCRSTAACSFHRNGFIYCLLLA